MELHPLRRSLKSNKEIHYLNRRSDENTVEPVNANKNKGKDVIEGESGHEPPDTALPQAFPHALCDWENVVLEEQENYRQV